MATKMKGIYKSFKYISQIFVKEREMEIGYPTDVKHVAHIGWDSQPTTAPSWMNEFTTASDFSATSLSNIGESRDPNSVAVPTWSSQDFEHSIGFQPGSEIFRDTQPTDLPKASKKHKRKKTKSASSIDSSSSTSRTSRGLKSKAAKADTPLLQHEA